MKKGSKEYIEAMLSKILMEEVRKEIDKDMIKTITDPNHISETSPMIFESEEDAKLFKENYDKMWDSRNDFLNKVDDE